MGMSIDTVDKWLKIQRQNLVNSSELAKDKKIESLDTAMSYLEDYQQLLRKYEKIEEAYKKYQNDVFTNIYADKKFVKALEEVFENGNNN